MGPGVEGRREGEKNIREICIHWLITCTSVWTERGWLNGGGGMREGKRKIMNAPWIKIFVSFLPKALIFGI